MIIPLLLSAVVALSPAAPVVALPKAPVQTGVQSSAYQGKFYQSKYEPKRKCIVQRESNGHYFSTNRAHGYFGAYQMNEPLTVGAAWMMQPELKRLFGAKQGKKIAAELRRTPMHKWHRYYQDMAFWTVANWKGPGSGLHHWNGGRWHC